MKHFFSNGRVKTVCDINRYVIQICEKKAVFQGYASGHHKFCQGMSLKPLLVVVIIQVHIRYPTIRVLQNKKSLLNKLKFPPSTP